MTAAGKGRSVRYLGVELDGEGAAEWMEGRRVVFVPRQAILGIELRRGIAGERPVLQFLFGSAAVLGGLLLLSSLVQAWEVVGRALPRTGARLAAAGAPMMLLGAWVLWTGLRPAYYLRVRTATDARKLLLSSKIDLMEVSRTLYEASHDFGYVVEWRIDAPRPPVTAAGIGCA